MNEQTSVSRCDASSCRFNENNRCTAGQIEVSFEGHQAACLTFSPAEGQAAEQDRAQQ